MATDLSSVVALVWVPPEAAGPGVRLVDAVRSLVTAHPDLEIRLAGPPGVGVGPLDRFGLEVVEAPSRSAAVHAASGRGRRHVLVVGDGVRVPPGLLDVAVPLVDDDARIASVAFWANAAGPLSFPHLGTPVTQPPVGHDERTLTAALRLAAIPFAPVPVLCPSGPMALLSAAGLSAAGGLDGDGVGIDAALAEFGLRCRARALVNVLDPSTYVMRSADTAERPIGPLDDEERRWLAARHPVTAPAADREVADPASPLRLAHHRARVTVTGMRIAMDGLCIGPLEMGTQVQILSLARALAGRDEVASVHLAMQAPVPGYARAHLDHPKLHVVHGSLAEAADRADADIVHRPYQPDGGFRVEGLGALERRVVVTLQDLISYRTGAYFPSVEAWEAYRSDFRRAAAGADGVVAISHDVAGAIVADGLPVEPDRLFVVPNGTDHLSAGASERLPGAFLDPQWTTRPFVLVLGATYAHKQRDLAIAAIEELRARSVEVALVLAGAQVPVGSSRRSEALARGLHGDVLELPDVTSEERTWLLRHADVLLYPTSAEGFGLVPFEAATLGTPSLSVDFGPLREVGGTPPVRSRTWAAPNLADALMELLGDPGRRSAQVAHLATAGRELTWEHTAERVLAAFAAVLARPRRHL